MHIDDFNDYVVVPTLTSIGLNSPSAVHLMLGTAVIESNLDCLKQYGNGPAVSFFQIEEDTYKDVCRYLNRYDKAKLKEMVISSCFYTILPPSDSLIQNLRWSCIIARLKYHMQAEKLPDDNDANALSNYYKKYYNTSRGKAEFPRIVSAFEMVINRKHD